MKKNTCKIQPSERLKITKALQNPLKTRSDDNQSFGIFRNAVNLHCSVAQRNVRRVIVSWNYMTHYNFPIKRKKENKT